MTDVLAALIRGLADNADAVKQARDIIKGNDEARAQLRDAMIEAGVKDAVDETSGYKAILDQKMHDVYVAEKLLPILGRPELIDAVYYRVVDKEKVEELVEAGVVTRTQLIREGALVRESATRPFIKLIPLKGGRP